MLEVDRTVTNKVKVTHPLPGSKVSRAAKLAIKKDTRVKANSSIIAVKKSIPISALNDKNHQQIVSNFPKVIYGYVVT
nr:hypothetical protein [uncultured Noviherbaspirillum sp.]